MTRLSVAVQQNHWATIAANGVMNSNSVNFRGILEVIPFILGLGMTREIRRLKEYTFHAACEGEDWNGSTGVQCEVQELFLADLCYTVRLA